MVPQSATAPIGVFQAELAAAEEATSRSSLDWSVREAALERRLRALSLRCADFRQEPTVPPLRPTIRRDAVSLYSSRWCHVARHSLVMAK